MSKRPSASNEAMAIHPLIGILLSNLQAFDREMLRGETLIALRVLKSTIEYMKPEHRPKDVYEPLTKEIMILEQNRNASANRARCKARRHVYEEWKTKVVDALWTHGYLNEMAFSAFYDHSGGRTSQ